MGHDKVLSRKRVFIFMILLTLLVFFVDAIPVPLGVDGVIYELDGVTEVREGIDFYVHNLDNDYFVEGKTGGISQGSYSVSVKGSEGDRIVVKAWNKYNQINVSLNLDGVIHNLNLLLNMTFPPIPPEIISQALTDSVEGSLYYYDVEAFDENDDVLIYKLLERPDGMIINESTGSILWIPMQQDVGENNVVVLVTDGFFNVTQTFLINVEDVNFAPIINSTPIEEVKLGTEYYYDIEAYDNDGDILTYYLSLGPEGMTVGQDTGIVEWNPKGNQIGNNSVRITVSDGIFDSFHNFSVFVYPSNDKSGRTERKEKRKSVISGSSGGGSGGGGVVPAHLKKLEEQYSGVIIKTNINSLVLKVEELETRPKDAGRISKVVYKYLRIENVNKSRINEAEINFSVNAGWLKKNKIKPSEIVMNRFNNNKWQELNTFFVNRDENNYYFTAKTPGFSYFAITVKEGVKPDMSYDVSKVDAPYKITGTVYKFGRILQADYGTKIIFKNLNTTEEFETITGIGDDPGKYYILVYGSQDDIISVKIEGMAEESLVDLREAKNLDFMIGIGNNGLSDISGLAILNGGLSYIGIISVILVILLFFYIRFKYKKR